jgi:hypothetical protein
LCAVLSQYDDRSESDWRLLFWQTTLIGNSIDSALAYCRSRSIAHISANVRPLPAQPLSAPRPIRLCSGAHMRATRR